MVTDPNGALSDDVGSSIMIYLNKSGVSVSSFGPAPLILGANLMGGAIPLCMQRFGYVARGLPKKNDTTRVWGPFCSRHTRKSERRILGAKPELVRAAPG